MNTWFKTKTSNITRYIIVNDGSNTALLDMYIGTDNKLKLAVRDTATNWKEFISSTDVINTNTWYFGGFSWNLNGSTLECSLYLNDKIYNGSISNILDFSGGTTAVNATSGTTNSLNVEIEQFMFGNRRLTSTEINQGTSSIYGKGRGIYLAATYVNNSYTYKNDKINSITQNGYNYNFSYDTLGNNTKVSVGTQDLITNTYELSTGNLQQSEYGNSTLANKQVVGYDYDNLDRIISKKFNGTARYNYTYDAAGNLGYLEDLVNKVNYRYIYDTADRLQVVQDNLGSKFSYNYDANNNLSKITDTINSKSYTTSYIFDNDNRPKEVDLNGGEKLNYSYDTLARLNTKVLSTSTGATIYNTSFAYVPGVNGSTSTKVASITNNGTAINYSYDKNGNIQTINADKPDQIISYYYNELNELIREDNKVLGNTIIYSYDGGGNILSKSVYPYTTQPVSGTPRVYNYAYTDTNWKDNLMSYDGKGITYDTIGNPQSYNGWTYNWEEGRQLKGISGNGYTISFQYNTSGIRTQKTVNGVTTNYHLVGNKVTYEDNGTDKIYYTYDSSDNLVSMNLNGVEYYYIRNAQGDIIGLFDKNGTQVVTYTYDTWGKPFVTDTEKNDTNDTIKDGITGSMANTVGVKNPYRYRGYRYDTETGLYYLQSRYYNAEWGRFINADGLAGNTGELLSSNMFAYCKNNPVNLSDPSGYWWKWIDNLYDGIKNVAQAVWNVVSSTTVGIAVSLYDAISDTYIGDAIDSIGTSKMLIDDNKKVGNVIKDKQTHAENVVGIGTGQQNYELKSFNNKNLMPDKSAYIEHCKEVYNNMSLLESTQFGRDITGLTWTQLNSSEQKTIAQNISLWDPQMTGSFVKTYGATAVSDAIDQLYGP